ncbi:MAG: ribosomal protein S18-alanine N-acetyltransferase [Clostridiales Family XIII bacterium]|jgi:ribosomal-protein-alanine N-acetyltransferase|nr:ribosomal protein S18-alanine N-acetyltransferase [Clostridiales Family XIII bacterium]
MGTGADTGTGKGSQNAIRNWIRIRRGRVEDVDTLWALDQQCFSQPWPRSAFQNDLGGNALSTWLIAETKGTVIGYIGYLVVLDECHIMTFAVDAGWRRQGIATMLMLEGLNQARMAGANRFTLEVRRSNAAALALYEKFGFRVAGYRLNYYEDNNEDAAVMWKYDRPQDAADHEGQE